MTMQRNLSMLLIQRKRALTPLGILTQNIEENMQVLASPLLSSDSL